MKILIAVDGSENSSQALHEIAGRNWADTDEVKIIHVVATPIPVTDMLGVNAEIARDAHAEAVRQGGEILDAAERIIAEEAKGLRMTSEVITAQPFHSAAEEIVNCAGREGSDVVVLGSRGKSMWKSLIVGSVSLAVIQHAPCSVMIVRPKQLIFDNEG
ncbi:MAG TPA: universal stress protein [Pyrinomonadaceae bacterium]|nr:universal stress protein [Pyrinomonadaceae bacterium]